MKRSFIISAFILALSILFISYVSRRGQVIVTEKRLDTLPMSLAGRTGYDATFDDGVYKVLNADQNLLRRYVGEEGDLVWLYIGYYGTQKGGRTGHLPQYCYPGSGWDINEMSKVSLRNIDGNPVTVNKITVSRKGVKTIALYWIHSDRDRVMDSGLKMNLNRFSRRIRDNRDDGAFVRISRVAYENDEKKCLEEVKRFAEELIKALPRHWPVEKEIR